MAFFDSETRKIGLLVGSVENAIACLSECRQALINSSATGKIDMWEVAA